MRGRAWPWVLCAAALLALGAALPRRADQDFEFDDEAVRTFRRTRIDTGSNTMFTNGYLF